MSIESLYSLKNKVALITAAGDGIGKAISLLYAAAGAKVACLDVDADKAAQTAMEITNAGGEAIAVTCNALLEESLASAVDSVITAFNTINIVANVVGGGGGGRENLEEISAGYLDKVYKLNTFSVYTMIRLTLPHMKKAGGGAIVNISSLASGMVSHNMSVYGASKAAVNRLTAYAAYDLGKFAIRVNAIAPGAVKTRALASVLTPEIEEKMLRKTPLGRLGRTEDIANAALFLVSDASSWISGQTLFISGGGTQELD